jgi:hypothetical protein
MDKWFQLIRIDINGGNYQECIHTLHQFAPCSTIQQNITEGIMPVHIIHPYHYFLNKSLKFGTGCYTWNHRKTQLSFQSNTPPSVGTHEAEGTAVPELRDILLHEEVNV